MRIKNFLNDGVRLLATVYNDPNYGFSRAMLNSFVICTQVKWETYSPIHSFVRSFIHTQPKPFSEWIDKSIIGYSLSTCVTVTVCVCVWSEKHRHRNKPKRRSRNAQLENCYDTQYISMLLLLQKAKGRVLLYSWEWQREFMSWMQQLLNGANGQIENGNHQKMKPNSENSLTIEMWSREKCSFEYMTSSKHQ